MAAQKKSNRGAPRPGPSRPTSGSSTRPASSRPASTRPPTRSPVPLASAAPPPRSGRRFELDLQSPPVGADYPQLLRGPTYFVGWSLLGVVMGISLFALITPVVNQGIVALGWALAGTPGTFADFAASAFRFEKPIGMLGANLGIATLMAISAALMIVVHRTRPRWLTSVVGRLRWRYLLVCLGVAFVSLNGVMLLSTLAGPGVAYSPQKGFWGFLVVILLTSPLQAAAEEIFFRGYLMQALGSLVAQPWFGVVVSSVIFALFHGTQNLPLFVDRLAFGLLAAMLVWRTGGLEAGIAAHVINNIVAYVVAGLTSSIAAVKAIQSIGWLDAAFDVGGFAVFALLAWLVARRFGLATRTAVTDSV